MVALYITIDTEYEFGFTRHRGLSSREENFRRSIRCATAEGEVGIFHQMDVFDRHGLKAVFFVDPLPALLWGTRAIADIVEPILKRGHDVQLHLHTEWLELLGNANPLGSRTGANIKDFTRAEQVVLLETAIDLLMRAGAPRPVAFRAGNYGANDDTLRALAKVGLTHDTSHAPALAAGECAIGLGQEHRRPLRRHGVIEVPIGCIGDALGGLRHAQLTALSYREIVAALRHARGNDLNSFTVVSHSFELLCRQRTRINRIVQRRFAKVCEHVEQMEGVTTATYADCLPSPSRQPVPAPVLAPAPLLNGTRIVEQVVANALYGRNTVPHDDEGSGAEPMTVAKALRYLEIANRARIG
ncbi:polysaccharide deacetylase family protein [Aurantiacibacter zhengii]|uniref:Polysaccharide deacetylase n=1 Tax=Aurantiacibacter zhengii TaxID=2307003 RepID=A0A418NUB8_9SPHN|nr:polysaccharide deacetylase family protein [Aurantiacibacter zhengii]RIV87601.1 hypothetical protein D2V07_04460 [Aurantiacibacter zhengii]